MDGISPHNGRTPPSDGMRRGSAATRRRSRRKKRWKQSGERAIGAQENRKRPLRHTTTAPLGKQTMAIRNRAGPRQWQAGTQNMGSGQARKTAAMMDGSDVEFWRALLLARGAYARVKCKDLARRWLARLRQLREAAEKDAVQKRDARWPSGLRDAAENNRVRDLLPTFIRSGWITGCKLNYCKCRGDRKAHSHLQRREMQLAATWTERHATTRCSLQRTPFLAESLDSVASL